MGSFETHTITMKHMEGPLQHVRPGSQQYPAGQSTSALAKSDKGRILNLVMTR